MFTCKLNFTCCVTWDGFCKSSHIYKNECTLMERKALLQDNAESCSIMANDTVITIFIVTCTNTVLLFAQNHKYA